MNTRSRNQMAARRSAERKRPERIISMLLILSLLCGNLAGFPSSAAELISYCGKEEHTHSEECYKIVVTSDPAETEGETNPETTGETTAVETTAAAEEETTSESTEAAVETTAAQTEVILSENPVCGKEEHTHELKCYSNPSADVETTTDWEATLPETLSGDWAKDLLATVKSQVGYAESDENYIVEEDGETISGYNRYGAWYSSYTQDEYQAYAPWNITFLFFSIYHSEISDLPLEETCPDWIDSLDYYELYRTAGEYTPAPGDLVFVDTDGDGEADRAGVVSEVKDGEIIAIEGDYQGAVAEVAYDLPELTVEPETTESTETTETEDSGEINVSSSQNTPMLLSDGETEEDPEPQVLGFADMAQAQADAQPENGDINDFNNTTFTIYFAAPSSWTSYTIKANVCRSNGENDWQTVKMTNTGKTYSYGGTTYYVYSASVTEIYGGFDHIQFQRYSGDSWQEQYVAASSWVTKETIEGKIYVNGSGWQSYDFSGGDSGDDDDDADTGTFTGGIVYFDAALSKLDYTGGTTNYSIPAAGSNTVYYYATGDGKSAKYGSMTKLSDYTSGSNTWSNVYSVELEAGYTHIVFSANSMSTMNLGWCGDTTKSLKIPGNVANPCFYADSSDDVIYHSGENNQRGGYWGCVYTIRDAEMGKGTDIVDISTGTPDTQDDFLYVNTTLYDYYSDYELNGNNRDTYYLESTGDNINTHQIYSSFRHFNQALSMFYYNNRASIEHRLYWGHFQPDFYGGAKFSQISGTLLLYNFNGEWNKSFYENNSMASYNGTELGNGNNAVQGLVDTYLGSADNLTMGGLSAPFFNEDFLAGSNALNTKFAEVYHDVSFPFVKKALESESIESASGTVDYWYFDSADTTAENKYLRLTQSTVDDSYYLEPTSEAVYAQTADNTTTLGYFPFNTSAQSGKATKLNYGFGQKFEINFRLTQDGTVTTTNNEEVPIEFNFSGDDDVWVFVDGCLVLDIGGGHGIVDGTINFKDKNSTVSSVKDKGSGFNTDVTTNFPSQLKDIVDSDNNGVDDFYEKEHTLTMFYMERGLWESNMKITFNFPDENILVVEKEVNTDDVNELFKSAFDNQKLFTFNIKTLATHFGTKEASASGEGQKTAISVPTNNLASATGITFVNATRDNKNGIHWYTNIDDSSGSYRNVRWGQIDLGQAYALSGYETLDLEFYYDHTDTPGLSHIFIQLLDANKNVITVDGSHNGYPGFANRTIGSVTMSNKQWIPISLDLSKLLSDPSSASVRYIRLGYDYARNVYFSNITFQPKQVVDSTIVGFIMPQDQIPDYGSAKSGNLEVPVNAVYTSTLGSTYRISSSGTFTLQDGESITFTDQFRRGSYMYLEEQSSYLYSTTWSMYEGRNEIPVTTSTVPSSASTVTGGQSMTNVSSLKVTDNRVEVADPVTDETDTDAAANKYQTTNKNESPGNTFVFRHYSDPDNTSVTTKLKVVYTNTINTADLTISKEQAASSNDLGTQEFEFYVVFTNIGGMSLESNPIIAGPYSLKKGETKIIENIPLGTWFTIHEVKAKDAGGNDIVVESVGYNLQAYGSGTMTSASGTLKSGTLTVGKDTHDTYYVEGLIPTTGDNKDVSFTFNNSKKYVVDVTVQKTWDTSMTTGTVNLPTSIYIQLQRKTANVTSWTDVGEPVKMSPGYGEWDDFSYTFENLDKYVTSTDSNSAEYQYRVVELQVTTADGVEAYTKLEANDTLTAAGTDNVENKYVVTYGGESTDSDSDNEINRTITNILKPKLSVSVEKVWKAPEGVTTPESINVQLQRRTGANAFAAIDGMADITLNANVEWKHTFTGLAEKDENGNAYEYRVVELAGDRSVIEVSADTDTVVAMGNVNYKVTFTSAPDTTDTSKTNWTITNTVVPKVSLDLTKIAKDTGAGLNGVTFKLDKADSVPVSSNTTWTEVGSDSTKSVDNVNGKLTFTGLEDGVYKLTEVKTANGYSLLKDAITITITKVETDGVITYTAEVTDFEDAELTAISEDGVYTLSLTIYNKPNLTMPATGGVNGFEFWILGGLCMMAVPLLLYTFFWFKKGGKYLQK